VRNSERRLTGQQRAGRVIENLIGIFSPFAAMSSELQSRFGLERTPACRAQHGRLEILVRGARMTSEPLANRIALARRLTEAARPLLREHRKKQRRRLAERAISVVFEDEQVVEDGIATSKFTYVASHDHDFLGTA
jgi:hypothetical protein